MRRTALQLGLCFLSILGAPLAGMDGDASERITIPEHGGMSFATAGTAPAVATGYVLVDPDPGNAVPAGSAIIAWRDHNVTISEAAIPAAAPVRAGIVYVESADSVNTGIAIVNANAQDATISFLLTTESGTTLARRSAVLPGKTQLAKYVTDAPFLMSFMRGTLAFTSSVP